jgi:hypothetical protein
MVLHFSTLCPLYAWDHWLIDPLVLSERSSFNIPNIDTHV